MASCMRTVLKVLSGGHRVTPGTLGVSHLAVSHLATRSYAAPARFYPRPVLSPTDAVLKLKLYQQLDATAPDQPVYIDLKLDMKLEKKKKVDAFVSMVQLPHLFTTGLNTVAVFTENPKEARLARENGAQFVGGTELVLEDQVSADFYISVPEMLPKIVPLKNKLRKKFPKTKR
ncbi:hypothetical protein NHX12_034221, partial [Muraenolepis orangiensis]